MMQTKKQTIIFQTFCQAQCGRCQSIGTCRTRRSSATAQWSRH